MPASVRAGAAKAAFGCGVHLVLLAALAIGIDRLTRPHLPPELRFAVALPAALLVTIALSNFWTLLRGYGQGDRSRAALLERARTGEPPLQDGHMIATGVVRAEGATLRAPISGAECVAYQYRLYTSQWLRGSRSRHREVPIYWGYASRPFLIDSARHAFRVMAVPQLADPPTQHKTPESRDRAKAYIAVTRYVPKQALPGIAAAAATQIGELLSEPTSEVRHDWQAADVTVDFDQLLIEEIVVPIGASVSISGRWSGERRAIVPGDLGEGELGATLVTGAAEELGRSGASELPFSPWSVAATGTVSLLAGAALMWLSVSGQLATWWRTPG